jgi:hypothetical protein
MTHYHLQLHHLQSYKQIYGAHNDKGKTEQVCIYNNQQTFQSARISLCHMKQVVCAKEFTTAKILNLPKGIGPSQKISQSHKVLFVLYIAII